MNTLDREIDSLRPILGAKTDALLARERREVFSIYPELRLMSWAGALLIAAGIGLVLKRHYDVIGPVAVASLVAIVALCCYAWVWNRRSRASLVDDYVLLLGALLLSADLGFVETQFHLLGGVWPRHLLLLALVHGVTAYYFDSRMVLALSISALGAWIGVEQNLEEVWATGPELIELTVRTFTFALALVMWRAVDKRYRGRRSFERTFEHFAANAALVAGLLLMFERDTRAVGCLLVIAVAALVVYWGVRTRGEPFVLYAFLYAILAVTVFVIDTFGDDQVSALLIFTSLVAAIAGVIVIHARFRRVAS